MVKYCPVCDFTTVGHKLGRHIECKHWAVLQKPRDTSKKKICEIIAVESRKSYSIIPMRAIQKKVGPYWDDRCYRSIVHEWVVQTLSAFYSRLIELSFSFQTRSDGPHESLRWIVEPPGRHRSAQPFHRPVPEWWRCSRLSVGQHFGWIGRGTEAGDLVGVDSCGDTARDVGSYSHRAKCEYNWVVKTFCRRPVTVLILFLSGICAGRRSLWGWARSCPQKPPAHGDVQGDIGNEPRAGVGLSAKLRGQCVEGLAVCTPAVVGGSDLSDTLVRPGVCRDFYFHWIFWIVSGCLTFVEMKYSFNILFYFYTQAGRDRPN